jgi:2-oxoglutarate dehydrogenase E1 component
MLDCDWSSDVCSSDLFCSGKVYFDLVQARAAAKLSDVAIVRIEQLYPFPRQDYEAALALYPNAKEVVWCQEEPENQGAWYQIKHRLQIYLQPQHQMIYSTRPGMATTAGGYLKVHNKEQEELVREALTGGQLAKGG